MLHGWLNRELSAIVHTLSAPVVTLSPQEPGSVGSVARGAERAPHPGAELPPLRMLLVWDNLAGHKTPEFVVWLFAQGIMPLYTPLSGSWLNMTESVQRILKRRALDGQEPQTPQESMDWLEAAGRGGNAVPTPFVWGGKRQERRQRARERRHRSGGSGASTRRPVCRCRRPAPNGNMRGN